MSTKLDVSTLPIILGEFVGQELIPKATKTQQFGTFFVTMAVQRKVPQIVAAYAPMLQMMDIMDSEGMIDLDLAYELAMEAAKKTGKIEIAGLKFDASDIETLHAIATQHATE